MKAWSVWSLIGIGAAGACLFACRTYPDLVVRALGSGAVVLRAVRFLPQEAPERAPEANEGSGGHVSLEALLRDGEFGGLDAELRIEGAKDPLRWLAWADANIPVGQREQAVYAVLAGWYRANPEEALKWAGSHERGFFGSALFGETAIGLGNIPLALRGLNLISDENLRLTQLRTVFAGLAEQDITRTLSAADTLEPVCRQSALLAILPVLARQSPELAMGVADSYADSAANRYTLLKAAANAWISQDGVASVQAYLTQQPASGNLDGACAAVASTLASVNPGEAGTWLDRISDPSFREEATVAVIDQITDSSPEVASRLVAGLINNTPGGSNETVTVSRLEKTVEPWARKDPPAAFSFVYSLNAVSSPARRALLQRLGLVGR